MPYYFFDRAADVDELSDLARKLGLEKRKFFYDEYEWDGRPFNDKEWFLKIGYCKNDSSRTPLVINTPTDHNDYEVLDILKQYIRICEPTKITNEVRKEYNLDDFK